MQMYDETYINIFVASDPHTFDFCLQQCTIFVCIDFLEVGFIHNISGGGVNVNEFCNSLSWYVRETT